MIYSVWKPATATYDYYEGSGPEQVAPKPKHLTKAEPGIASMQAGWPLPGDAKRVGGGVEAKGAIATLAGTDDNSNLLTVGLLVASAYALWKVLR